MGVTKQEILQISEAVRDDCVDDPTGQCYPASKTLCEKLVSQTTASESEVEVEEVLVGPSATIRHYVVSYPAKYIDDVDVYGRVLIDITLDQYSTENEAEGNVNTSLGPEDTIPEVLFYPTKEAAPYTG